jgi:hypothetical protein
MTFVYARNFKSFIGDLGDPSKAWDFPINTPKFP